jgi:hypothetical protein
MTGFWCIRNPWNTCVAIDEFGPGTLDGNPLHGGARDACGPAALENTIANVEGRTPDYSHIGAHRAHMMTTTPPQWALDAQGNPFPVFNPATNGCFISNVAWEFAKSGWLWDELRDYTLTFLSEADIRRALAYQHASVFIVTNAAALAGNELNVHNHFVVVAGYGGDNPDGSVGKLYVLNSDIAGQHGTATGQWTPLAQFLLAQPHGFVTTAPPAATPPLDTDIVAAQAQITIAQNALLAAQTLLSGEVHEP